MLNKLEVKGSSIQGLGVFTKKSFKKGQRISYIGGKICVLNIRNTKDSLSHPQWIGVKKNVWIDPLYPYNYLNHSCEPSASVKGKVTVVALKDLKPGDEVTVDYSLIEGDPRWHMYCKCGSKHCRKIIRSINFLPRNVFKNYMPVMPTYFRNLYIKNHKKV